MSGSTSISGSSQQVANDMTRNYILGLPKDGPAPGSEEAAQLKAAEAFVSDIQQEILAYDIANAQAVEAYTRKWWSKVPYFGRYAKEAIEIEEVLKQEQKTQQQSASTAPSREPHSALDGLDIASAQAAAAAGGTYLHTQTAKTSRGLKVERTSALDTERLRAVQNAAGSSSSSFAAADARQRMISQKTNTWLFKKQHPGWVPLMQRWWVPWTCLSLMGLIWTPDVWKLRALYFCDHQYALFRQTIHKAYWRATMPHDEYMKLIADIEAERPRNVKSTDCPF